MTVRYFTDELAEALRSKGIVVANVERSALPGDSDVIRLSGEDYLAVDYEDFERTGAVAVSLNTSMSSGGDTTDAFWLYPNSSADDIAAELGKK